MQHLILVKAAVFLESPGCHDAKRAGQGHPKKLERLAWERVGKPKGGSKIIAIIGGKVKCVMQFRGVVGSTPGERWKTVDFSPAKPNLANIVGG